MENFARSISKVSLSKIKKDYWDYLEDATYQISWGSMVCMTCNKFSFECDKSIGPILFCEVHQKLIFQGDHLTHSCELYQKNKMKKFLK